MAPAEPKSAGRKDELKKSDIIKISFKRNEEEFLYDLFTTPYVLSRIEDEAFFFLESRLNRTSSLSLDEFIWIFTKLVNHKLEERIYITNTLSNIY